MMPDDLDLSLPEPPRRPPARGTAAAVLMGLLLVLVAVNLLVSLSGRPAGGKPTAAAPLAPEDQKELALKLERQGLHDSAAQAWRGYLAAASLDAAGRAKVWYRIGTIRQEAGDYEQALGAYYRSESLAAVDELAPEIGRRTQECLEALGKFAALRHELTDRVGLGEDKEPAGGEVVAEIGTQQITQGRLDRMIEQQIERQLEQFAAYLPPEQRRQQKEAMLKRFSSPQARVQMLQQFVAQELLYRKAREAKLADEPATRELLAQAEKMILAQRAMERELADQIKITRTDIQSYYEAHKKDYVQPERAQVSHILVKNEKAAAAALKSLKGGADFADLAKRLSQDESTKAKGGAIDGWVDRGSYIPGVGTSDDATAAVFATEAGKVADRPVKTDKGYHLLLVRRREPERQKSFGEVAQQVHRALRGAKEREVQHGLLERLKHQYDVVIHHAQFEEKQPEAPKPGTATSPTTKKRDDPKAK